VRIAVVIVTYNSAAQVGDTLRALDEQLDDGDELMVVDNASQDGTVDAARAASRRVQVLRQRENLGFAGGCHVGAAASSAPLLLFLNPDAQPGPGCIAALRSAAVERPAWGAWQALVTMRDGTAINTAGNVAHFLGLGWAGRCGRPVAEAPQDLEEVAFASGAALMVRREAWQDLGGFDRRYFMYCEDLDLCLRLRLCGWRVGIAPDARVEHEYSFGKGQRKWYLLERNRWWTVVGDYPASLLILLSPALLAAEFALMAVAWQGAWLRQKLQAQASVAGELPRMLARRREVQALRSISAEEFARVLSSQLDSPYLGPLARVPPVVTLQRSYWSVVLGVLAALTRSYRSIRPPR
jgi:N-acetylglucosaminyl-diphospho-decaprenol L-rhamnosyltransferase